MVGCLRRRICRYDLRRGSRNVSEVLRRGVEKDNGGSGV